MMGNKEHYIAQVALLLDCLPALKDQSVFALKGGTAINFFIQDLPRLSIDIDLTFLNNSERSLAFREIEEGLRVLGESISKRNKKYKIKELKTREGQLQKLIVMNDVAQIKIETSFIMRTTLLPTIKMNIKKVVEDKFAFGVKDIPVVATEELYAGKICAALSRQHPRDFFDIKGLLEKQGVTDGVRQAFVIYLVCSPRPMHELLKPHLIVLDTVYENEFVNMTEIPVSLETLLETREKLIKIINQELSHNERKFILSVKQGQPDYSLMPFDHLDEFPALKWKIINIQKMDRKKHVRMIEQLGEVLAL